MRRNGRPAAERPDLVVAEGQIRRQSPVYPEERPVLEGELDGALDRRQRLAAAVDERAGIRWRRLAGRAHRRAESGTRLGARRAPGPGGVDVAVLDAPGVGAQGAAAPSAPGSVKLTVVPWPSALSTWSSPPWAWTRCFTIASPSPVPPTSRDRVLSTR